MRIGGTSKESITKRTLQRIQRRRTSFKSFKKLPNLQIKSRVMTPVTVKRVFGANSAVFEKHTSGIEVTGETSVVESGGVPLVTCVDVNAAFKKVTETVEVAGAGGLENVAVWDFF